LFERQQTKKKKGATKGSKSLFQTFFQGRQDEYFLQL